MLDGSHFASVRGQYLLRVLVSLSQVVTHFARADLDGAGELPFAAGVESRAGGSPGWRISFLHLVVVSILSYDSVLSASDNSLHSTLRLLALGLGWSSRECVVVDWGQAGRLEGATFCQYSCTAVD